MANGRKTGGRQRGTPNKLNRDIREMIINALNTAGGEAYLVRQAEKAPAAFMALLGRVLPLQVAGTDAKGEATTLVFEWANATTAPLTHEHDNGAEVADDVLH